MSLRAALRHQGDICSQMGSPFTGRVLHLLAERMQAGTPVTDRLLSWPGDLSASAQSVPLRVAGALHGLVLDGSAPDLAAAYPPHEVSNDVLWPAIEAAFVAHAERLDAWLDEAPQTNEVARSAALIAAGHWLTERLGLPLALSELGASAGLNLMWDRYALEVGGTRFGPSQAAVALQPDWSGPLPPRGAPQVVQRRGVDLNPLDPGQDGLRLLAYTWADQAERMARARAAIAVADGHVQIEAGDAAGWLKTRLSAPPVPGTCHLIFHTVAWQYFPSAAQETARAAIEAAGAQASAEAPLAWFGMEADDSDMRGAALRLRLWTGDTSAGKAFDMGRSDFHGRWVDWSAN